MQKRASFLQPLESRRRQNACATSVYSPPLATRPAGRLRRSRALPARAIMGCGSTTGSARNGASTLLAPVEDKKSRPVSRVLSWTVIPLGLTSPSGSSNLPGSSAGHANAPLFGLAPGGVCLATRRCPRARCALTAPFHPCHASRHPTAALHPFGYGLV